MTTKRKQKSAAPIEEDRSFNLKRREMLLAGSTIAAASALGTGFAAQTAHAQSGSLQTSGTRKGASAATKSVKMSC